MGGSSIGVGVGGGAGALWWLARNPASRAQLDLTRRRLRLVRLGLSGRRAPAFLWRSRERRNEEGSDDEGGLDWRPAVRLRSGETVLLSELWSHDQAGVREGMGGRGGGLRLPHDRLRRVSHGAPSNPRMQPSFLPLRNEGLCCFLVEARSLRILAKVAASLVR